MTAWSGWVLRSTAPTTPLRRRRAIGQLQQALQIYSASPSNRNLAENAVDAARQVVRTLNSGTDAIQSFRADMDSEIGSAVSELNDLLTQFKDANSDIVSGTRNGRDVSDSLDKSRRIAQADIEHRRRLDLLRARTTTWSS